jgi:uncharacterized membrane protein YidH (DUF202 family)
MAGAVRGGDAVGVERPMTGLVRTALKVGFFAAFLATFVFVVNDLTMGDRGPNVFGSFSDLSKAIIVLILVVFGFFLLWKINERSTAFLRHTLSPSAYKVLVWAPILLIGTVIVVVLLSRV